MPWHRSGLDDEMSAGNGAAMRVAPVGLLNCVSPSRLAEDARLSSVITHRHPDAVTGAYAVAYLVAAAARGELNPVTAVADTVGAIGPGKVADALIRAQGLIAERAEPGEALRRLGTSGYIVHTVSAAVLCFLYTPRDYERTVINAVMGGNDADTTAAVAGAISGAFNGEPGIPVRWREGVERSADIVMLARALYQLAVNGANDTLGCKTANA
jgi:poly(ADP-ribose) glycohydrolase ARH3